MTHYVCTGECGGVSNTPGTCQDEKCSMHKMPLVECNCGDKESHKNTKSMADDEMDEV